MLSTREEEARRSASRTGSGVGAGVDRPKNVENVEDEEESGVGAGVVYLRFLCGAGPSLGAGEAEADGVGRIEHGATRFKLRHWTFVSSFWTRNNFIFYFTRFFSQERSADGVGMIQHVKKSATSYALQKWK